ncbi:probable 6-phosphogluconolactonase 4, chloroplastic, partial [Tanacetum coccineum]
RDMKTNSLLEVHLNWTYCEKIYALENAEVFFQLEDFQILSIEMSQEFQNGEESTMLHLSLRESVIGQKGKTGTSLRTRSRPSKILTKSDPVPIPKANIYPIKDNLSPEKATEEYEHRLKQFVANKKLKTSAVTRMAKFDLMLLGMGLDGHDASRFCWHFQRFEKKKWVTFITDSPKPPPPRTSFTFPPINSTYEIANRLFSRRRAAMQSRHIYNVDAVDDTTYIRTTSRTAISNSSTGTFDINALDHTGKQTWWYRVKSNMLAREDTELRFFVCQANNLGGIETIKMAVGAFGGEGSTDGSDVPPLMVENKGESNSPAISSQNCPLFIVVKLY